MDATIDKFKPVSYISILISLASIILISYCAVYYANRGFDLSDEAFYVISSHRPITLEYNNTYFGVLNHFFCFGQTSLINLRVFKFLYQFLGSIFFAFSLIRFVKYKKVVLPKLSQMTVSLSIILIAFCNYDYLPMTLSYNSWSLIFSFICISIFLLDFTFQSKAFHFSSAFVFGFIVFCLFLSKFPNAFIYGFFYVVLLVFFNRTNSLLKLAGFIVGLALASLTFIKSFEVLTTIFQNYYDTIFSTKHAGNYFDQFIAFYYVMLNEKIILIELSIGLTFLLINAFLKNKNQYLIFIPIIINYIYAFSFAKGNSVVLYHDFVFACIILFNSFLFFYSIRIKPHIQKDVWMLIIIVFMMPFLLMLGTDNSFYYTCSHTIVFAVSGALLLILFRPSNLSSLFFSITSIVIAGFMISILWNGAIKSPYRQTNLNDKTYPLQFTNSLDGIYENYEHFVDYHTLNFIVQKWNRSHELIFTYFNYLGIEEISGNHTVTNTVISDGERNVKSNEFIMSKIHFNKLPHMLLLPNNILKSKAQLDFLKKSKLDLQNYQLVFSTRFLSGMETAYVYILKDEL